MMPMRLIAALLAGMTWLAGCASIDPSVYASEQPALQLTQYFNGTLDGHGMLQSRDGTVKRRFTVVIDAKWNGAIGTLDERFSWSDGKREQRIWTLRRIDDHHFIGTAPDVVGEAEGVASGNALNWRYTLKLPVGDSTYDVQFDDWMFLIDDKVMLNRAVISKFGVRVGEVLISFTRR